MPLKVIDFYRQKTDINPFIEIIADPTFVIKINKGKEEKELVLELKGNYLYPILPDMKGFEGEAYNNYDIITKFMLSNEEEIKNKWHLDEKEIGDIVYGMYKVLVSKHSHYSWVQRRVLLFLGFLKFHVGRCKD